MDIFFGSANAAELINFFLDVAALVATLSYLTKIIINSAPSVFEVGLVDRRLAGMWHNSKGKRSLGNQHIGRKKFA